MECRIESDSNDPGRAYIVNAGGTALDVTVVEYEHSGLKDWHNRVRRLYTKKNHKTPVAINARNRHNTLGSGGAEKDGYYEIFQICIGQHCLLIELEPWAQAPRTVKDFMKEFISDNSFVFVGVGIKDVVAKMCKDYEDTDFKWLSKVPNPVDLRELVACESRFGFVKDGKCGLEKLVKIVLGVEYEKPRSIAWYGVGDRRYSFSDEVILWSSVDVYLMVRIAMAVSIKSWESLEIRIHK